MRLSLQNKINNYSKYINQILGLIAMITLFLKYGFQLSDNTMITLITIDQIIAGLFVFLLILNFIVSVSKWQFIKESPFEIILMALFIVSIIFEEVRSSGQTHYLLKKSTSHSFIKLYFVIIQIYIITNGLIAFAKAREKWQFFSLSPARIIVSSYGLVVLAGTLILKLPKATYETISWMDAFFTSASAVCITGLSTVNIAEVFTFEGQLFLLLLIQLGGLGIITIASFLTLFVQRGLKIRNQLLVQELFSSENFSSLTSILKAIIGITFLSELIGAVGLYFSWRDIGLSEFDRIFASVFHSVSAYCNAGFSIFPEGLETKTLNLNAMSMIVIMIMIVSGGLGFYTFSNIFGIGIKKGGKRRHLSLQTKIILLATAGLILLGAVAVWLIQRPYWQDLSFGEQVLNSFFLSITTRTAGFSNVSIAELAIPTIMVMSVFMYIGGAPNSSSGGIKITTVVTMLFSLQSYISGKDSVKMGWNQVSQKTVKRAFVVIMISIMLMFITLLVLTITEDQDFLDLFFETVSAFGTVGLSRGITPELSTAGKFIIIFLMFIGRIGLFTFSVAIIEERDQHGFSFPEINLMVG